MGPELTKALNDLAFRMRLLKTIQEEQNPVDELNERDILILSLLNEKGKMTISQIAAAVPGSSDSTISTAVTKLWRNTKLVSKKICPENQRITYVELTDKGVTMLETINKQRQERFQAFYEAIKVSPEEKQVLINIFTRANKFFDKYLGFEKEPEKINS